MNTTTTDLDALLAAVLAEPDEDTVRLVYADALEEAGQAERAEFIRVQIEYEKIHGHLVSHDDAGRCDECARAEHLSDLLLGKFHVSKLGTPLPWANDCPIRIMGIEGRVLPRIEWDWYRGFVSTFRCTAEDWLAHADTILAQHPITAVTLTTEPGVDAFLQHRMPWVQKYWLRGHPKHVYVLTEEELMIVRRSGESAEQTAARFRPDILQSLLKMNFPRITFTLPPPPPYWNESPLREAYQAYHMAQQLGMRPSRAWDAEQLGLPPDAHE